MKNLVGKIAAATFTVLALAGAGLTTASSADAATATADSPCALITFTVQDDATGASASRFYPATEVAGHTVYAVEEDSNLGLFLDPDDHVIGYSVGFDAITQDSDTATFHVTITCDSGQTLADRDMAVPDSETFAIPS